MKLPMFLTLALLCSYQVLSQKADTVEWTISFGGDKAGFQKQWKNVDGSITEWSQYNDRGRGDSTRTIISKKSIERYYFGNILKTDPALFVNHKLGHFDEVIRKANAMPLKMVISNEQFEMESVAIEILPIQFNEAMFALPAGVKTEKSQF